MSGLKVTREGEAEPLSDVLSIDATYTGDDADWDTSAGGSTALTVSDGYAETQGVDEIIFDDAGFAVTDNGDGSVTIENTAGALALDDLTDVTAPAPGDGDALTWDGAAWVPVHAVTEDDVIALITPDVYTCDSLTVISAKGSIAAGTHADLHAVGGTTVQIDETATTPGIQVEAAFSGVDGITNIYVHGYYTASHTVTLDLYNYDTTAWDTVITFPTSGTVMTLLSAAILDGSPYFDGGGNAVARFDHDAAGNPTHRLYLDYLALSHAAGTAGALALDGLSDVNAGAPSDQDVLTWDDYNSEWIAQAAPGGGVATDAIWDAAGDLAVGSGADTAAVLSAGSEDDVLTIVSGVPAWAAPTGGTDTVALVWVIDGGGSAITTGIKGDLSIPFACTLTAWRLLADQAGAIVVDIWRDTLANFPPTDADALPGSGKEPTIAASGTNAEDTSITDWTGYTLSAGDTLRFNVDSAATVTRVTLTLTATR